MDEGLNAWSPCSPGTYGIVLANFSITQYISKQATSPLLQVNIADGSSLTSDAEPPSSSSTIEPSELAPSHKGDTLKDVLVELIIGDFVQMLETHPSGWVRGYVFTAGEPNRTPALGIFPQGFIQPFNLPTFENLSKKLTAVAMFENYSELEPGSQPSDDAAPPSDTLVQSRSVPNLLKVLSHPKLLSSLTGSQNILNQVISQYYESSIHSDGEDLTSTKPFLPAPVYPSLEKTSGPLGAVVDSSAAALRDWYYMICTSVKNQNYTLTNVAKRHFGGLLELRRHTLDKNEMQQAAAADPDASPITVPVLDAVALSGIQKNIIKAIEEGNGALSLSSLLLSDEGDIVTNLTYPILHIKDLHLQLDAKLAPPENPESGTLPKSKAMNDVEVQVYHVYLDIKLNLLSLSMHHYSTEYRFSIYSKGTNSFITDDHVIVVEDQSGSEPHLPPPEAFKCLFTNFNASDVNHKHYLVCRVFRTGPLKESEVHSKINCRRPLALGLIEINDIFNTKDVSASSPFQIRLYDQGNDQHFPTLLNELMSKSNSCIPLKTDPISLALRCYTEIPPTLNKSSCSLVDRTTLSEPLNPNVTRNSIYVTLESGEFLKTLGKSFEVSVQLRDESHESIQQSFPIHKGQATSSEYFFSVYYHTFNPKWNEVVRIDLPSNLTLTDPKLYLYFVVRSCSKSAIDKNDRKVSMGFLPLFEQNGAVISSEPISLPLYRYDKKFESAFTPNHPDLTKLLIKDTLNLSIDLVSTTHTQSTSLVHFLCPKNLMRLPPPECERGMKEWKSVHTAELAKFSVPLMEALMVLVSETPCKEVSNITKLVLDNLLNLLSLVFNVRNTRFSLYQQALQTYIETQLKREGAHYNLIQGIQDLIEDVRGHPKNIEGIRKLQTMFKCIAQVVRILVRCGSLIKAKSGQQVKFTWNAYIESLNGFLNCITSLMTDSADHLSAIQQLAFVNFSSTFPILIEIFEIHELVDKIISFTDASSSPRGSTVQKKLSFILAMIKSDVIMNNIGAFFKLSNAVLRWVGDYIGWWDHSSVDNSLRAQVYNECMSILCELLNKLHIFQEHAKDPQYGLLVLKIAEGLPSLSVVYKDFVVNPNAAPGLLPQRPSSIFLINTGIEQASSSSLSMSLSALETSPPTMVLPRSSPSQGLPKGFSGGFFTQISGTLPASAKEVGQPNPDKINVAAMLIAALNLLSPDAWCVQLQFYFTNHGEKQTSQLFSQLFALVEMIYCGGPLPSTWVNLHFASFRTMIKFYHALFTVFKAQYSATGSPGNTGIMEYELKFTAFRTFLLVLVSEFLQAEWKSQIWRCGFEFDILMLLRQSAQLLVALWQSIRDATPTSASPAGGPDTNNPSHVMISSLLSLVIELTMSPHPSLAEAACRVLFDMMQTEYEQDGTMNHIEYLCMDCLDHFILTSNKGDHAYRRKLVQSIHMLTKQFEYTLPEPLKQAIQETMANLNVFLTLLITLSQLPRGLEYEDEQSNSIYKLAKFMKQIGRTDYFLKYIHYLAKKQVTAQNLVESGLTLKLHADMLNWNDTLLPALPDLGFEVAQKACQRKEQLLLEIASYLEEGKAWESAIEVCKELSYYYQEVSYDYAKQSETLLTMARLYACIAKEERCFSEYFRVGYYGMGFPASIRNKQFVYRGHEWEKIGPFCERIQNKHPDSVLLKSNAPPSQEILNSDLQYLQISAVQPEPDYSKPLFQKGDMVPESVRKFYVANDVSKFSVARPFRKGNKTDNEFLCLWTEKITFVTEDTFPHVLRRSEVIECTTTEYSPIENAVQAMTMKNKDLLALEKKYEKFTEPQANCNPLTMSINGAVDAPVNGGVPMYKKAFIKSNFVEENPDKEEWVKKLEESINEQVIILDRCLAIHNRVVPTQMRPLHDTIVSFFYKNFAEEIERLGLKQAPPTPEPVRDPEPYDAYLPKKEDRIQRGITHRSFRQAPKAGREKQRGMLGDPALHGSTSSLKRASDFLGKIRGPAESKGSGPTT